MHPDVLGEPFAAPSVIRIDQQVVTQMIEAGRQTLPYEFSALLTGQGNRITGLIRQPSETAALHRFAWEGEALIRAMRQMHEAEQQWLGVVHTHPHTAPLPSAADLSGWHYPMLSYWILSFAEVEPALRCYRWQGTGFAAYPYEMV